MIRVRFVTLIALCTLFAAPHHALAQTKPSAKPAVKLPPVGKILDEYSAATGSPVAFARIKTARLQAKSTLAAQKINITSETLVKLPNKIYVREEIVGQAKFEQGYDGKIGWSRDPLNGLRTLSGAELAQISSGTEGLRSGDWRTIYKSPKLIGLRKVGTADAYAVRLLPKRGGEPVVIFIDVKTKLETRRDMVVATAQGSTPTQTFSSDYRVVDGIKMPFKIRQIVSGAEAMQVFESVRFNVPIDDTVFTKPAPPAPKP